MHVIRLDYSYIIDINDMQVMPVMRLVITCPIINETFLYPFLRRDFGGEEFREFRRGAKIARWK